MGKNEKTRELILSHIKKYPQLKIRDIFKFIYHSAFGCEHLVTSQEKAEEYILKEYKSLSSTYMDDVEALDGEYSRISLSALSRGLGAQTLAALFFNSAKEKAEGINGLLRRLDVVRALAREGQTPFSIDELEAAISQWEEKGYEAVHHSDEFREEYKPAYRVISNKYVKFLPLFIEIDKRMLNGKVILAIEGGSASGKTTLGKILEEIYGCTVLHMDDFFLQPYQRTPERFKEIGGNIDKERFLSEVLKPLKAGEDIWYKRFNCTTMQIEESIHIVPKELTVIEGAYSTHPLFDGYYDFSVFINITEEKQKERISERNTPELAIRFFNEWIPMEKAYFEKTEAIKRCDIVIDIN